MFIGNRQKEAMYLSSNLLLTDREGQYSPVRLELARLVSSLLYGTRAMLVLSLPVFENKKYTVDDRFHGNGPYGEILTKKETNQNARIYLAI